MESYVVTAPLWMWNAEKGGWHFLTVDGEVANAIRFDSVGMRGGFGSVKVVATIAGVEWRTSLFPSGETYLLPVKADVRRRTGIRADDIVTFALRLA